MKREHGEEEVKGVEQGADAGEGGGGTWWERQRRRGESVEMSMMTRFVP